MITKNLFGFAILLSISGKSQTVSHTVLGSDGGHAAGSGGSISWTIGETVSGTYSSSSNITTVGFLQTEQVDVVTLLKDQGAETQLLVYPNPVKEELKINLSGLNEGYYQLEITDAIGKRIYSTGTNVTADQHSVNIKVNEYSAGNYFLNIKNKDFDKSIKIIKTN